MKVLRFFLIVTLLASFFFNSLSWADMVFEIFAVFAMLFIIKQYPIQLHISKYVVFITYWFSMVFMPSFHLVVNQIGDFELSQTNYNQVLSFGVHIFLVTTLIWLLFSPLGNWRGTDKFQYIPKPISTMVLNIAFVVMYGLSIFSYAIGLSRMGADQVALPFHLSGIITLLRTTFFPIFFAIVVENYILRKRPFPKKYYILFVVWSLLEVIVRLSKGALVFNFMTVSLLLLIYYRPNFKTIVRYVAPIAVAVLFLYPILETMRSMSRGNLVETFKESRAQVIIDEETDRLLVPLNRLFMMPQIYAKDYLYIDNNKLFDFSKAPAVMAWGGAARYQTFVIDGYPPGVNHSSGTTGLQDPLLHGGYGLCYIVIIFIMLMAIGIDSQISKKQYSIYIRWILIIWSFCNSQNISSFYDSVGLQTLLVQLLTIWVAFFINFRRKVYSS